MTGDCHARFCGSPGVRFPRATQGAVIASFGAGVPVVTEVL